MQKNEIESLLYTTYKNNSKWIKDLNLKAETLNYQKIIQGANRDDLYLAMLSYI